MGRIVRPDEFRIDYDHQLADGLVFGGFGRIPGTTRYEDESLFNNTGTLTNMDPPSDWVWSAELGRWVLDFSGSTSARVAFASTALGVRTVSLWCYVPVVPTATNYMILGEKATWQGLVYKGNSAYQIGWHDTAGGLRLSGLGKVSIRDNAWHHIAYTANGTGLVLYYDGNEVASNVAYGDSTLDILPKLGARYDGTTGYPAAIADPLIYNRVITPSEIQQLADPSNVMLSGLILPPTRRLFAVTAVVLFPLDTVYNSVFAYSSTESVYGNTYRFLYSFTASYTFPSSYILNVQNANILSPEHLGSSLSQHNVAVAWLNGVYYDRHITPISYVAEINLEDTYGVDWCLLLANERVLCCEYTSLFDNINEDVIVCGFLNDERQEHTALLSYTNLQDNVCKLHVEWLGTSLITVYSEIPTSWTNEVSDIRNVVTSYLHGVQEYRNIEVGWVGQTSAVVANEYPASWTHVIDDTRTIRIAYTQNTQTFRSVGVEWAGLTSVNVVNQSPIDWITQQDGVYELNVAHTQHGHFVRNINVDWTKLTSTVIVNKAPLDWTTQQERRHKLNVSHTQHGYFVRNINVDWEGITSISVISEIPLDWTTLQEYQTTLATERLSDLAHDHVTPIEWAGGIVQILIANNVPVSYLTNIGKQESLSVDVLSILPSHTTTFSVGYLSGVRGQTRKVSVERLSSLLMPRQCSVGYEGTQSTSIIQKIPVSWRSPVASIHELPYEYTISTSLFTKQLCIEALYNQNTQRSIYVDYVTNYTAFHDLCVGWWGVVPTPSLWTLDSRGTMWTLNERTTTWTLDSRGTTWTLSSQ